MTVSETTFGPKRYLVWRKEIPTSQVTDKNMWLEAFKTVRTYMEKLDIPPIGPGTAIYFRWDEPKGYTDLGIGEPINQHIELNHPNLQIVTIPESKALHAQLKGSYEGLIETHGYVKQYIKDKRLISLAAIEEYTVDPTQKVQANDWETNVYHLCGGPTCHN